MLRVAARAAAAVQRRQRRRSDGHGGEALGWAGMLSFIVLSEKFRGCIAVPLGADKLYSILFHWPASTISSIAALCRGVVECACTCEDAERRFLRLKQARQSLIGLAGSFCEATVHSALLCIGAHIARP